MSIAKARYQNGCLQALFKCTLPSGAIYAIWYDISAATPLNDMVKDRICYKQPKEGKNKRTVPCLKTVGSRLKFERWIKGIPYNLKSGY